MTEVIAGAPARVRIKGRTWSVVRFFLIAVSFMCAWVLVSSELGYYSRWFGPQILLELSMAFYLPSIPVLVISGQFEKVLDARLGVVQSMALRLLLGLCGCTACAAAFPFLPTTHSALLWTVAVLGTLSAIAFSTSYQLVQWFRHADIIALGLGAVGTGPLVLAIQLGLGVGSDPTRWQWIAMFEVVAVIMAAGVVSALSLFAQYWKIMTGEEEYLERHAPLLSPAEQQQEQEQEDGAMRQAAASSNAIVLPPDPFQGLPVMLTPRPRHPHTEEDDVPYLHHSHSVSICQDITSPARPLLPAPGRHTSSPVRLEQSHSAGPYFKSAHSPGLISAYHTAASTLLSPPAAQAPPSSGQHEGSSPDPCPGPLRQSRPGGPGPGAEEGGLQGRKEGQEAPQLKMTALEETAAVMAQAGVVMLAFLISVTVTYLIFPFFTFVKSSGWLGASLPQVLFFTRIFADLAGRFAPRCKALLVHSPALLLTMALTKVAIGVGFFFYVKALDRFHHDLLSVSIVVVLWSLGGYINTCANILAPHLVENHLVSRASALLALVFQVAHFVGLALALVLAYVLFEQAIGH